MASGGRAPRSQAMTSAICKGPGWASGALQASKPARKDSRRLSWGPAQAGVSSGLSAAAASAKAGMPAWIGSSA